ncbi:MAG: beta-galactosidase [Victivallaceae bacterium]
MNPIGSTIEGSNLLVNGKPFYVKGAEIHYFRLPYKSWDKHLKQAKQSGINTISACMPWYFHEPEEGQFDFFGTSRAERDLSTFIRLVKENDLKLIAHPGPFMNCEFRTGGIPEWLFRKYPETMSHRSDGNIATGRPVPAEGEPLYRQYVKKWYDAIIPLLTKHQADKDGPIILFQPDNELSAAWSFGLLNSLYDHNVINNLWPGWLSGKYKNIEALNRITSSSFSNFNEVTPPAGFPQSQPDKLLCFDWLDFKRGFFADWGATMATWAKELGMNTPVIFNEPVAGFYGHGDHAGFGNILKSRGIEGTTVCHTYSDRIFDLDGMVNPILGIELVKSSPWGGPPMSVEINCNWNIPRLSRSAINWSPLLRSNLSHGMKGYSIFTYSEGIADLDDSINGPGYFENTCLNVNAYPSNANSHIEKFNRLLDTWSDSILNMESIPDLTLAYSPAMRTVDFLGAQPCLNKTSKNASGPGGESFAAEPALNRGALSAGHDWLDGYENVSKQTVTPESGQWMRLKETFILLSRLNMQFDLLDLVNPNKQPGKGCLIVPCTGTLEEESIDYLLQHIDNGGGCLFFPTVPAFTTSGKQDCRIASRLGLRLLEQIRPAGNGIIDYGAKVINVGKDKFITETGWIFAHQYSNNSEILGVVDGEPVIGKTGNVVVSGVDARFTTGSTLEFWESVLVEKMKVSPSVKSRGNYYYASLLGTENKGMITVANVTGDTSDGELLLPGTDISMMLELGATEARCLPINLELDGVKLRYSTSEIIRSADGKSYELHGSPGTRGCLAFPAPMTVKMDGRLRKAKQNGKLFMVNYVHRIKPVNLSLIS